MSRSEVTSVMILTVCCPQLAVCPLGSKAASLDIAKAYRNSPILLRLLRAESQDWTGCLEYG